eukprot:1771828-Ditylum_brightwellii.AAC.1
MAYKPCTITTNTGTTMYHQQLALQQLETNATINARKTFTSDSPGGKMDTTFMNKITQDKCI